jgi:hypothetical protein
VILSVPFGPIVFAGIGTVSTVVVAEEDTVEEPALLYTMDDCGKFQDRFPVPSSESTEEDALLDAGNAYASPRSTSGFVAVLEADIVAVAVYGNVIGELLHCGIPPAEVFR